MRDFAYHRPKTLQQAGSLFAAASDPRFLAGGQTLLPSLKLRLATPSDLIDLAAIAELRGIKTQGTSIVVGAMSSHADVANAEEIRNAIPALAQLAEGIGDRAIRNCGTIGGSLANNDPAACYPAAVLGLGAIVSTSKRSIAADQFFRGLYETALEPGELITSVAFPIPKRAAYIKFENPASRFALVGVFVCQSETGVRCAVTGAGAGVFRVASIEQALAKNFSPDALSGIKISPNDLNSDIHASAEYRAHLIAVLAKRAVEAALKLPI